MARVSALAAGGIVLRRDQPPRVAVVRLRKRDEWVLPKGKLDKGETPRAAARREVLEETGHDVTVQEFLGTLVYESGGRSRVVHYWRMEAGDGPVRELMNDVRAVEWLPLDAAIERLSRGYERVFLENVGPIAVSAMTRRQKEKAKRHEAAIVAPQLPLTAPAPQLERPSMPASDEIAAETVAAAAERAIERSAVNGEPVAAAAGEAENDGGTMPPRHQRASFAERVRNWLGHAA